jgi:L-fucose isomerase-like protein
MRVCSVTKGFLGAKIGLVGPRPERFETCIFSEDAMIKQFNQRVLPISLLDIIHQIENIEDFSEVEKIIQEIKNKADLSEVKEETVVKIAKLEYILKRFAEERNLSGMGIQCWTAIQEAYGVSPCFAMGRLTEKGIMTSCEVDIYGALTMLIQYLSTLGTTPPHFVDWTIRHQERENVFLSWHCGNAPPKLACKGCKIRIREHDIMKNALDPGICQGTAEFQLKPGIVTLSRLVEYNGKFKMLITRGKIEESKEEIRGSWCWVSVNNLDTLYRKLVEEGFIHHASLIHGDYVKVLESVCKFLKIESVIV